MPRSLLPAPTTTCHADGEHVAAAPDGQGHVIHLWGTVYGDPEQTLEAGADPVVSLVWHPMPYPMQLLALVASGKAYIWTKVGWLCVWLGGGGGG